MTTEDLENIEDNSNIKDVNDLNNDKVDIEIKENENTKTSAIRTCINLIKSFIGTGILGLPYAFLEGGLFIGIVGIIIVGIISNYAIHLLVHVNDKLESEYNKSLSYGNIAKILLNKYGRIFVDVTLSLTQIGFCCVYVIFISDNLNALYSDISTALWVLILMPFLVIICCIRSFKTLAYISFIGQVTSYFGYIVIIIFAIESLYETELDIKLINLKGLPIFFGMAVFSFAGIGTVIPMKQAMKEPNKYFTVLNIGFIVISILLLLFGTIGYCGYGSNVNASGITLNLPQDSIWTKLTQIGLIIGIFATYPIVMYPFFEIIEDLLFNNIKVLVNLSSITKYWTVNLERTFFVFITSIIAISIPYFSLFVSLVGGLGSSLIAFIIPCIFHLIVFKDQSKTQKIINIFLVFFGIIASIISSTVTIFQLIQAIFDL